MYPNDPNQPQQPPQAVPPQPQQPQQWGQPGVPQQPQQQYGYQQQPAPQPYQQPAQPYLQSDQLLQPVRPVIHHQPLKASHRPSGPAALLFNEWMQLHWKMVLLVVVAVLTVGITIYQIVYPGSRLIPGTKVDGVALGGMRKEDAAKKLNDLYSDEVKLSIFFGKKGAAFQEPKLREVGVKVLNEDRINAMEYPFYLRFIPTSIFWANSMIKPGPLAYAYDKEQIQKYTQSKVGDSCTLPAQDATLKLVDSQLQVVQSIPGGTCDITQFQKLLAEVRPTSDAKNNVQIDSVETPAKVDNDKARLVAEQLNDRMKDPMPISLGTSNDQIPGRVVLSWLDFKSDIPEDSIDNSSNASAKLVYSVNKNRMSDFISTGIAAKVIVKPGVSKVSTTDFKETARTNGAGGRDLDQDKIVSSVTDYINRKNNLAIAVTHAVPPIVVYTRTYTATSVGLSALLAQFAQENPGTYGIAMNELTNVRNLRSATFNADARLPSAGIESLYFGYIITMDKSAGTLRPVEQIAGTRDVQTCMNDMYVKQDDKCRLGFYNLFGFAHTTARASELGITNTLFADSGGVTSANDLQKVMVALYKNTIGRIEGFQSVLAIGRNIRANDGVPAGINVGSVKTDVAHFVGEDDRAHNETAVVYSTKGVYVLSVVSQDSSWDKITLLAKKIQAFKELPIPVNSK